MALNFPVAEQPGPGQNDRHAAEAGFPAGDDRPDSARWSSTGTPLPPGPVPVRRVPVVRDCGESDPTGDEKFFALSRQAKCIPIVATQSISSLRSTLPGESWRTLLQTFRTKIFLALSDDFSARTASELCGKEEQFKLNYTLSENGQDAQVSMLTGRAIGAQEQRERQQELQPAARLHLRAEDLRGTEERAEHRSRLRRREPAAADVLLSEAVLPGSQLLNYFQQLETEELI